MPRTLASLVAEVAARGDLPALVAVRQDAVETWSCGRLAHAARSLAAGLIMHGVRPGDRVALFAANAPEWIASYLGIVFAGGVVVPLDAALRQDEALRQIADSGSRLALVGARQAQLLAVAGHVPLPLFAFGEAVEGASDWQLLLGSRVAPPPEVNEAALAALLYTSGTTGPPKGVPLTHGNLMANVDALARQRLAGPGERVLVPLPLHHAYPMTVGALGALASGAAIVLPEGLSGPEIADALRLGRATVMIAVPRLLEAMVAAIEARAAARGRLAAGLYRAGLEVAQRLGPAAGRRLFGPLRRAVGPDLRTLASGGARLEPATARRLAALGFEILVGYGLTETAPLLAFTPRGRVGLDTVGRPLSGVELRIAGDGEILARGACVFSGYWRNPTATANAFTADGWFRTGDLGALDADGELRITGRLKEIVVLGGGKKVQPDELEATYGQSALIREIAVLERDGRLVALVVPDEAALKARGLRAADALHDELDRAARSLPPQARLAGFAVTRERLPRTTLGKLRRFLLPALYSRAERGEVEAAAPSDADREFLARPEVAPAWTWLQGRFAGRTLGPDTSPQLDLGIDSLGWVNLGLEIEQALGVRLTEERVARVLTLRDLLREIAEAAAVAAPPPTEEPERWLRPVPALLAPLAVALYALTYLVMRLAFRLEVVGAEGVPRGRPLLIVPNHASFLDPFAVAAALGLARLRRTYWAGWTGILFGSRPTRAFSRLAQIVPVDPAQAPHAALRRGRAVLAAGYSLVWFAEGRRSPTGELRPFLAGVGRLALDSGAAALPVQIRGSFAAWPSERRWPRRGRITVVFGPAIEPGELRADLGPDPAAAVARRLHDAVAALHPPP